MGQKMIRRQPQTVNISKTSYAFLKWSPLSVSKEQNLLTSWFYLLRATKTGRRKKEKKKIKPAIYALSPNPRDSESLSKTSATRLSYLGPLTCTWTNTQPPPPDTLLESLSFPLTHGITPCPFKGRITATFPLDIQHPLFFLLLYHSQQQADTLLTLTISPPVNPQPVWRDTSQRHLTRWLLLPSGQIFFSWLWRAPNS